MKKPFYKKLWFWLVIILVIGAIGAAGTKKKKEDEEEIVTTAYVVDQSKESTTEKAVTKTTTEQKIIENGKYKISLESFSVEKDYEENDVLIIEYSWTNNSDEEESFMTALRDKVYQNGIECNSVSLTDSVDSTDQMKDIKPGATFNLKVGYVLWDKSKATVEVSSLFGDDYYLIETLDLGGGEGTYDPEKVGDVETSVKVIDIFLSKDYEDKDVLVVKYEFTNGSKKPIAFETSFTDKVYQNGVELSSIVFCDDVDSWTTLLEIKPGVTYVAEEGYLLNDMSDVEIEVKELFGKKVYYSEKKSLQ
ncbi:protein of unknown function [Eubacterium ruminantium]|nr:protein of unknown function [Eubacterium ruminantium]